MLIMVLYIHADICTIMATAIIVADTAFNVCTLNQEWRVSFTCLCGVTDRTSF